LYDVLGLKKGFTSRNLHSFTRKIDDQPINHWILEVRYFQTKVYIGRTGETSGNHKKNVFDGALTIATGSSGRGLAAAGG